MIVMLLALHAALTQPGALRTFEDWTVGCDNGRACRAVSLVAEGDWDASLAVMVRRDAGPEAEPVLILAGEEGSRLVADGRPLPVRLITVDGNLIAHPGDNAVLIPALRDAHQIELRDAGGQVIGRASLAGLAAAMRHIDVEQGRAGTVTALVERGVQFAVLGTGEPRIEQFLRAAAQRYPKQVAVEIGFNEALAHQIEAGADLFLMPSLYEPCGLNQMYSLKYGTIPIVRAIGGLKDTVEDYNAESQSGTGFVFSPYDSAAMIAAIDRSLLVYRDKQAWTALRQRAMGADFSWDRSAKLYSNLYEQLLH